LKTLSPCRVFGRGVLGERHIINLITRGMSQINIEIEKYNKGEYHSVVIDGVRIPKMFWNLRWHKWELECAVNGITPRRGWKLKPLKEYYGLKGRSAKDVHKNFVDLVWNQLAAHFECPPDLFEKACIGEGISLFCPKE